MSNLTITVNEDVLRHARSRAALEGKSVNALLSEVLEAYAGIDRDRQIAMDDLMSLSKSEHSRRGGREWTRDDLHDRLV